MILLLQIVFCVRLNLHDFLQQLRATRRIMSQRSSVAEAEQQDESGPVKV